jgi:hypothetical protein
MEFKVKSIDGLEQKGTQQIEQELLEKHEESLNGVQDEIKIDASKLESPIELKEEDVLSYIGKRYNKQINSFDELMTEREKAEELPSDVAAYFNYKKETGRGIEDFVKLKTDFSKADPDQLIRDYYLATQEGLDKDDVEGMMDDFLFDEDLDEESAIKKIKVAKKKVIAEAKKYFISQQEKYKTPLESNGVTIQDSEKEGYEAYKQYIKSAKTQQEQDTRKGEWFQKKTDDVFSTEFKGFEFTVNDKKFHFSPADAVELKKNQASPMNFINKFLDVDGLMNDAAGYHRSLAIAMNPDRFSKFFYEQGLADATEEVMRKTKNINMSERKAPESFNKGGLQVRATDTSSGRGLKIRSIKRI